MKGIITYLLVYIFIGLLPSHGSSLSVTSHNNLSYNEEHLGNGIYFYRILVGGKIIKTDKIVIIK